MPEYCIHFEFKLLLLSDWSKFELFPYSAGSFNLYLGIKYKP